MLWGFSGFSTGAGGSILFGGTMGISLIDFSGYIDERMVGTRLWAWIDGIVLFCFVFASLSGFGSIFCKYTRNAFACSFSR